MGRKTFTFGVIAAVLGLALGAFPFVSVWLLTGEVLHEVPVPGSAEVKSESREAGAIFSGDFVLASRVLTGTTAEQVTADLLAKGFERDGFGGQRWLSRECCGSYDAVLVENVDQPNGTVSQRITVFDSDVQAVWGLFAVAGFLILLFGVLLAWPALAQIKASAREAAKPSAVVDG